MKPDFIIGGVAKNGTTYLSSLIRKHSQIELPNRSMDYSYFDNDVIYNNNDFKWYESIFDGLDESKTIGQISADCAFNPGSIERIKKDLPNVKLIFIFRNPVDSVYSLYWHQVKMGREYHKFEKALSQSNEKVQKSYYHYKMYSYIDRYRFSNFVNEINRHFDDSQILFVPFEGLINNEFGILNKVFDFLEIDKIDDLNSFHIENIPKNKAKLPKYQSIVWLSYQLQRIKLKSLGRYILNKTLSEKRPPKMSIKTKIYLEDIMKKDIEFHNSLLRSFNLKNNS